MKESNKMKATFETELEKVKSKLSSENANLKHQVASLQYVGERAARGSTKHQDLEQEERRDSSNLCTSRKSPCIEGGDIESQRVLDEGIRQDEGHL